MKLKFALLLYAVSLCFFLTCGCSVMNALRHPFAAEGSNGRNPTMGASTGATMPALSSKPTNPKSGIASFFSTVMEISIALGLLSLSAGGALIYFGMVIPGVKCIIGGIALPVAAIWLDFHYALVIWIVFISAAIGFAWALHRYDPKLASTLLADAKEAALTSETELKNLKTKLNL